MRTTYSDKKDINIDRYYSSDLCSDIGKRQYNSTKKFTNVMFVLNDIVLGISGMCLLFMPFISDLIEKDETTSVAEVALVYFLIVACGIASIIFHNNLKKTFKLISYIEFLICSYLLMMLPVSLVAFAFGVPFGRDNMYVNFFLLAAALLALFAKFYITRKNLDEAYNNYLKNSDVDR